MAETLLERIRTNVAAEMPLSSDDQWFLIDEIGRYRDLLRHARYQSIQVSVTAKEPKGDGPVEIVAHVVASEEATERAVIREIRRTLLRLMRAGQQQGDN
jgi:hypothetical protein